MRRLAVLLALAALVAGCGGGAKRISPDHATLTDVAVRADSVTFTFDVQPDEANAAYATRASLAECGSGKPVRPAGAAVLVVHFRPAQSQEVPKRIVMPSGTVLDVWKVCDFEADVGWAVGVSHRAPFHLERTGGTVTLAFGR